MPASPAASSPRIYANDLPQAFVAAVGRVWFAGYHWLDNPIRHKLPHLTAGCPHCRQGLRVYTCWYAAALLYQPLARSWKLITWDLAHKEPFASLALRPDLVGNTFETRNHGHGRHSVRLCPAGVPAPVPEIEPHDVRAHLGRIWRCDPLLLGPPCDPGLPGREARLPTAIPPALDTPAFRDAWTRWLGYRERMGRPVSADAAPLQMADLAAYGPAIAVAAILTAIKNDWARLEPEKEGRYRKHAAHDDRPHYAKPLVLQPWM